MVCGKVIQLEKAYNVFEYNGNHLISALYILKVTTAEYSEVIILLKTER